MEKKNNNINSNIDEKHSNNNNIIIQRTNENKLNKLKHMIAVEK